MNNLSLLSIPVFKTERLIIRNFVPEDAQGYFNYHNSVDTTIYYDWKPDTLDDAVQDIKMIIDNYTNMESIQWAITTREDNTIIGDLGIINDGYKGEINYMLSKSHWGYGFMTEAINTLISFFFSETDMYRIQALSTPNNLESEKLLLRLGFNKEGLLRKYGYNPVISQPVDLNMWSILKDEFHNKPS